MKLDQDELALRMLEAAIGMRRPGGLTATQALEYGPESLRAGYRRAAVAAIQYFIECGGGSVLPEPVDVVDQSLSKVRN